jgi:hypothetical protein
VAYSVEDIFRALEARRGPQDQWGSKEWEEVARFLAKALVVSYDTAEVLARSFPLPESISSAKRRRGRPPKRQPPGFGIGKMPVPRGRKPEPDREAKAFLILEWVTRTKKRLGRGTTDKRALEELLYWQARDQGRKSNAYDWRYGRFRKLLTEGRKRVSELSGNSSGNSS